MEKEIITRMGNGQRVKMSPAQVKEDLLAGTKDAADKGRVPELSSADLDHLFDIVADKNRVVGVEPGEEIVFSDDVTTIRMSDDEGAGGGIGLPMSRTLSTLVHERAFAQDSALMETAAGANVPETKAELNTEMQAIETTQLLLTVPLLYLTGAFLLWYFDPLGPCGNPSELLPQGKIQESRDAQEEAAAKASEDLIYMVRTWLQPVLTA